MEGALILPTLHTCFFPRQLINKDYTHGSFALGTSLAFCFWGVLAGDWRELSGVEASMSWHPPWMAGCPSNKVTAPH